MLKSLCFMAVAIGIVLANGNRARAQVAVSIGEPPVCPYGYDEAPPYTALPMATTAPSGSRAVESSERDLGSTGPNIFTDTSIIVLTIARATTVVSPRAATVQRTTVQSFMARRWTIRMAMRHHAATGK